MYPRMGGSYDKLTAVLTATRTKNEVFQRTVMDLGYRLLDTDGRRWTTADGFDRT